MGNNTKKESKSNEWATLSLIPNVVAWIVFIKDHKIAGRSTYTIPHCSSIVTDTKLQFVSFGFLKTLVALVSLIALFKKCIIGRLEKILVNTRFVKKQNNPKNKPKYDRQDIRHAGNIQKRNFLQIPSYLSDPQIFRKPNL